MNRLVQLLESLQNLQFYNMQETSCWGSVQKKWKRKKKKKLHTEIGEIWQSWFLSDRRCIYFSTVEADDTFNNLTENIKLC